MHWQSCQVALFTAAAFMSLTASLILPDASLGVWQRIDAMLKEHRDRARAARFRENTEKMKKFWVVDMSAISGDDKRP